MNPTVFDPSTFAGTIGAGLGDDLTGVLTTVAPIAVGVLAGFWALRFVSRKVASAGR